MTPEKFFDYLEGKLPPPERERLERALISDPELQKQFVAARQIHRGLQRPAGETAATTRAGSRGRQLAAAFAFLVAMNVAIGLFYIFQTNKPPTEMQQEREAAFRQQLQSSLEKSAAATFTQPTIGPETIALAIPAEKQDSVAQALVEAAEKTGGSGTKDLPGYGKRRVFVLVPASAEAQFRETLHRLGGPAPRPPASATPASPDEPVHLEIVLSARAERSR